MYLGEVDDTGLSVWARKDIFARRRCEDLLIPFSCTSTDIVQFEEKAGICWRLKMVIDFTPFCGSVQLQTHIVH